MDAAREEDKHGGGRPRPAGIGPEPRIALSVSDQPVRRVGEPKDPAPPGSGRVRRAVRARSAARSRPGPSAYKSTTSASVRAWSAFSSGT